MYKLIQLAKSVCCALAILAIATAVAEAQSLSVSYRNNLITIRCDNAALGQVFEQIKSATGMELFLEEPIKSKRLTADIEAQPLNLAVERLLAGVGVNYAMMYDQEDWRQVAKLFIGAGGGPVASRQPAPGVSSGRATRRAQPIEDNYDESEEFEDGYEEEDPFEEDFVDDEGDFDETEDFDEGLDEEPAGGGYLPPPPDFPRSSFTPGLESSPFGTQQPEADSPSRPGRPARPPAYYPFTDQFGRPIPVPSDPNNPNEQPAGEEVSEEVPEEDQ